MEFEQPHSQHMTCQSFKFVPDITIQPPSPRINSTRTTDENQNTCQKSELAENVETSSSLEEAQSKPSEELHSLVGKSAASVIVPDKALTDKTMKDNEIVDHQPSAANEQYSDNDSVLPNGTILQNGCYSTTSEAPKARNIQQNTHISFSDTTKESAPQNTVSIIHINGHVDSCDVDKATGSNSDDNHLEPKTGRSLHTKSSSMSEADLQDQKRPSVMRRASKKSVNSATVNDSDQAFAERKEELMTIRRRSESVLEFKEHAHCRLQDELLLAQQELKLKDDECKKLQRIREQMSEEIEELTASLFEEANKMVQDAHIKRMQAEKLLKEANSKIDMLQAEVTALKTLVITSTPSAPNPHLNPQITGVGPGQDTTNHKKPDKFVKGHRRSTSHHNISREISLTELKLPRPGSGTATCGLDTNTSQTQREIDPEFNKVFQSWRLKPTLQPTCPLLKTMFREDVMPCMAFPNQDLAKSVLESVINNTLNIEPVQEKDMYRKCVLTQCNSICKHRVKLKEGEQFIYVSQIARNRVAAVCDLFTYLRYIVQGLVKSNEKDIYWEIIRLRKQMCLAKLGYVS